MNNKNQVAVHCKFPELHFRNQFVIFVYIMTAKSLLIVSFYYYFLKEPLSTKLSEVHSSLWLNRKSNIH